MAFTSNKCCNCNTKFTKRCSKHSNSTRYNRVSINSNIKRRPFTPIVALRDVGVELAPMRPGQQDSRYLCDDCVIKIRDISDSQRKFAEAREGLDAASKKNSYLGRKLKRLHSPSPLKTQKRGGEQAHGAPSLAKAIRKTMPLEFELAPGRMIGGDHPCYIIAEIGQNHQGEIQIAKDLIKVAKDAGADCAKFQKSELSYKFNKAALARPYTSKNSWGKTYGEHKEFLEFSHDQYKELQDYANQIGIHFTASGMDEKAVDFLHDLGVPFFKVGSGDTNNLPYISRTAEKGRPMIISSGMQSMETMRKVYKILKDKGATFCFLQCTSAYPLEAEDVHLRCIEAYRKEFPDIPIGYSGHESGATITVGAVALGAKVVERHITMDKSWKGSDHEASLEPDELKDLVRQIRLVERALGGTVKEMRECELPTFNKLGKSIVAARDIPSGAVITADMLGVKVAEPKGLQPENIADLIGKRTTRAIDYDDSIREGDVTE